MTPPRWGHSFRPSDFSGEARRDSRRRPGTEQPLPEESGEPCLRGLKCAGRRTDIKTREQVPARAALHLCPACRLVLVQCTETLPASCERLAAMSASPVKAGRAIRVPPGSRVLANPEADALMREIAAVTGGWAARVRAIPQLSLSRHGHPHGSQEQVRDDCKVLTLQPDPLIALPVGPMARTWTYLPGGRSPRRQGIPCRKCGIPVTPAPSGERWWPAACTHPRSEVAAWREEKDGRMTPVAWACAACSQRVPPGWQAPAPCDHEPSRSAQSPVTAAAGRMPSRDEVEADIAGLEFIRSGDGWTTALTFLHGGDAGCELIELRYRATRLLRENPADPEFLDGIPCRKCDDYALVRAPLPAGPEDPRNPPPFSECSACRNRMTRTEYDEWVKLNGAHARHAGAPVACRRCKRDDHGECRWAACACGEGTHPRRRAAA